MGLSKAPRAQFSIALARAHCRRSGKYVAHSMLHFAEWKLKTCSRTISADFETSPRDVEFQRLRRLRSRREGLGITVVGTPALDLGDLVVDHLVLAAYTALDNFPILPIHSQAPRRSHSTWRGMDTWQSQEESHGG